MRILLAAVVGANFVQVAEGQPLNLRYG